MHVLAGINYNHQAPDKAAKLARRFSCVKRRVAPTPPALAHSTYETAGRSPASSNRESTQHTIPRGVHSCSRPSTSWLPRLTSISSTSSPTPSTWSRPTATERIPAPPDFHASPQTREGCGLFVYRDGHEAPLPHVAFGQRVDAPSEARGADGSRAGRRPRAHPAARPTASSPAPTAAGASSARNTDRPQPMFHVKHLPIHRPRYPVSPGKWHT